MDLATKIFWGRMEYFGIVTTGVMWFAFALDFTGSEWWKRSRNLALLCFIPVLTLVGVWTNQWHGLIWRNIYFSPDSSVVLVWEHGIGFWIYDTYIYVLILLGIAIFVKAALKARGIMRSQLVTILGGILVPVAGNVTYVLGFSPVKGLDLTPFCFLITGGLYAVTIFRLRFMDIIPAARVKLVEHLPDGIIVISHENYIVDMNPAAARLMNVEKQFASGKRLDAVSPKLDLIQSSERAFVNTELEYDSAGSKIFLDVNVMPLTDSQKHLTGRLIVLRDITMRRRMEQKLRESESRYSALVEQSNEGVVILKDGTYKFANQTILDVLGYTHDDFVGKRMPFPAAEEDIAMVTERYAKRLSGQSVPDVYELRLKRKDQQVIETEISVGNIIYDGQSAQMITIRDISERKLTQRKIEALYQEEYLLRKSLQDEMEKRTRYTRALIHELRTPLTAILASSELLEPEVHTRIPQALVKNIRRASLNLEQRINELIELARGEIGMLKINPLPLDMAELIRDMVSEMTPVASARGLTMVSTVPVLPLVMGDRSRLRQVLTNLISNAIKFTARGMIEVSASQKEPGMVLVQVKDTGRGIKPDDLKDVFDPYRRKSPEGQELSGLGIGLALSKMFVDLHKGNIWAESNSGGSTFSFTIPVYLDENKD